MVAPPAALPELPRVPVATTATAAKSATKGRDAFVMLSGGGTPLSNNYSQFLQARAMAGFFERSYGPDRTWVFFGVGNRDGETPRLADARKQVKRDNLLLESWLPGSLAHNRPATRESFLKALREEILPTVRDGGTLYLFIGDHGTQAREGVRESLVTMWQLKEGTTGGSWSTDNKETLGVTELRNVLA